jgi:hypothetical protein
MQHWHQMHEQKQAKSEVTFFMRSDSFLFSFSLKDNPFPGGRAAASPHHSQVLTQ